MIGPLFFDPHQVLMTIKLGDRSFALQIAASRRPNPSHGAEPWLKLRSVCQGRVDAARRIIRRKPTGRRFLSPGRGRRRIGFAPRTRRRIARGEGVAEFLRFDADGGEHGRLSRICRLVAARVVGDCRVLYFGW